MQIVINQLLYILLIFFQGLLFTTKENKKIKFDLLNICTSISFGIIIDYFLFLAGLSHNNHLIISISISLISIIFLLLRYKIDFSNLKLSKIHIIPISIYILFLLKILLPPAGAHDTRFIWLFHAKMIYFGEGLSGLSDLANVAYDFSHASYPKLLPMLMGRSALMAGIWNEHLPKFGILILFSTSFSSILALTKSNFIRLFLLVVLIGLPEKHIWNGYADGYLTCLASLSILYFLKWSKTNQVKLLKQALALIFIVSFLKTEGTVLSFILMTTFILSIVKKCNNLKYILSIIVFSISPILMWHKFKKSLSLKSWLTLDSNLVSRIFERISSAEILKIGEEFIHQFWRSLTIVLIVTILLKVRSQIKLDKAPLIYLLIIFFLYNSVLFGVYLATPHELNWHLATSIDRTLIFGNSIILISIIFINSNFSLTDNND